MAGISDKALKSQYHENKYRFNDGSELQNKEFSDGSGLEAYDFGARMYDAQIGRFWSIDHLAEINEIYSPYSYANNNPILLNDPSGLISDSAHPQQLDAAYVSAAKKTTPAKPDVAAAAGPSPISAAAPIQCNCEGANIGNAGSPSQAGFGVTLLAVGEGAGEITITGLESVPIVAAGAFVYGVAVLSRPDHYQEPTHVPTGDISIGLSKPHLSTGRGPSVYPYPGNDALKPPPGFQWRGKPGSQPGSKEGNWHNPGTDETLRPDLDHGEPIGPHWDYKDPNEQWHRLYPDGTSEPKKDR